jgi:predicted lipoprotein with Yx(FWY)xxD motif
MRIQLRVCTALLTVTLLCSASLATAQAVVRDGVLTDPAGMTLYVNDNDKTVPGQSVCYGPCMALWTPFLAKKSEQANGDHGLITRTDGQQQWTYKGRPLYRWIDDKQPGDRKGDATRAVWHVAKP